MHVSSWTPAVRSTNERQTVCGMRHDLRVCHVVVCVSSQGAGSDSGTVTVADLSTALDSYLTTKRPTAASATSSTPADTVINWDTAGGMFGAPAMPSAQPAPAAAPPATATAVDTSPTIATDTATATADTTEWEVVDDPAAPGESKATEGGQDTWSALDSGFLSAMQDALEALGYDLSSMDIVGTLAGDASLTHRLMPLLMQALGQGMQPDMLRDMVRQWQEKIKEQMEVERKRAQKGKRPVWRCAACGRYGCPVAPYIEREEEYDLE